MNTITLRGYLTADPKINVVESVDEKNAQFTLAVPDRSRKNDSGKFEADFIRIVAFAGKADIAEKYLKKGSEIIVTGKLHTYSYKKDNVTLYGAEVKTSNIEFVSNCGTSNDYDFMENVNEDELPFK